MFLSIKLRKTCIGILFIVILISVATVFILPSSALSGESKGVAVPIIMYHSILDDDSKLNDYILSPITLEEDMMYLKKNGYQAIFVNDLIDYVNKGTPLPEKPVVLTFDDGSYNNLTNVLPLLKKYDFKATFSVVGKYSEIACEEAEPSPVYSYLDFKDIIKLEKSGYVEIANHSYDMHSINSRKGSTIKSGESYEDYRQAFFNDTFKTQHLLEDNCNISPNVYTYPFGFSCSESRHLVVSCGFKASLGVEENMNYIREGEPECLFNLYRYNRPSFVSTEDFMKKALKP